MQRKSEAEMKKTDKNKFNPQTIEPKWQSIWENEGIYHPDLSSAKRPFYNLMMFPYPSAEGLHIGGVRTFAGVDIYGRFKRMQGHDVFQPFGLDGFGIHAENYALKIGENPMDHATVTEKNFYRQIREAAIGVDWGRTVETYKPDYYKWTQWLFVELFKSGLAYRKKSPVNFCPSCKTVLADEQVIDGKCERCSSVVEKKNLEQWFFRITNYADRLLSNIEDLDWTEKVKIAQRNWIGKKEGIEITYSVIASESEAISLTDDSNKKIAASPLAPRNDKLFVTVFTTRPDTNFGATFIALAPEHALVGEILKQVQDDKKKEIEEYVDATKKKTEIDRQAEGREKTGVFTGFYATNQLTGYKMPIWVSDFVLMGFGTGAVVGVPGHDTRDFEFAQKFGLKVLRVVVGKDGDESPITKIDQVQEEEGMMINSEFLNGLDIHKATEKIMDYIQEKGFGKRKVTYHLRDWLISRQRYWGPPIPMIFCENCAQKGDSWFTSDEAKKQKESGIRNQESGREAVGWYPAQDLPVKLPRIEDFKPLGTGNSPLGNHPEFYKVKCPHCGKDARRETDVSDTFLDSAWYFLRYISTEFDDVPFDKTRAKKWLPVTMYIGGAEHSVLHLLYARFITMFIKDIGLIQFEEPFKRFYAHGLIIKDGAKMSKSKGNVVGPDLYIKKYGADTLRMYLHFLAPFSQEGDFR
ncbi:MAG TPA: class I tRNA ligase family protein, partial [Candidatus Saccharimonadales bacterium]|nr:class I tRNA ligase family protein [Candidatus Saccharimonadales bacterium]